MEIVCPVFIESDLNPGEMLFAFDKVDWNLCTHIIRMDQTGKGTKSAKKKNVKIKKIFTLKK